MDKVIQGLARNRSNYSLQVVDRKGALHLISMTDVKALDISQKSPMPADFGTRLSAQEMEDLLAYLSRQSLRPPGTHQQGEREMMRALLLSCLLCAVCVRAGAIRRHSERARAKTGSPTRAVIRAGATAR